MPGASLDKADDTDRLHGQMRVKLGPITAAFAGDAELRMDDAAWSGAIHGTGRDQKNNSRARADIRFGLAEQDPGTRVDVTVDFALAGTLAQFSRGAIVQGMAQRLTDEFARNLAAAMEAQVPPLAPASPVEAPAQAAESATGTPQACASRQPGAGEGNQAVQPALVSVRELAAPPVRQAVVAAGWCRSMTAATPRNKSNPQEGTS